MTIGRKSSLAGIATLTAFLFLALHSLPSHSDTANKAKNPQPEETQADPLETAHQKIARLRQTANQLRLLATQPMPANVPSVERDKLVQHSNWLREEINRMTTLADHWEKRLQPAKRFPNGLEMSQSKIADLNYFYELQTAGLQKKLQLENARYSTSAESTQPYYATTRLVIGNMR